LKKLSSTESFFAIKIESCVASIYFPSMLVLLIAFQSQERIVCAPASSPVSPNKIPFSQTALLVGFALFRLPY